MPAICTDFQRPGGGKEEEVERERLGLASGELSRGPAFLAAVGHKSSSAEIVVGVRDSTAGIEAWGSVRWSLPLPNLLL